MMMMKRTIQQHYRFISSTTTSTSASTTCWTDGIVSKVTKQGFSHRISTVVIPSALRKIGSYSTLCHHYNTSRTVVRSNYSIPKIQTYINNKPSRQLQQKPIQQRSNSTNTTSTNNTTTTSTTTTGVAGTATGIDEVKEMSWLRIQYEKGNVYFLVSFIALIYGVELVFQYREEEEYYNNPQRARDKINLEIALVRQQIYNEYKDYPCLYQCIIQDEYKMGGSHGLLNVTIGTVVDIIEENVGPLQDYHLCRSYDEINNDNGTSTKIIKSIGWYPIKFMQPYTTTPATSPRWYNIKRYFNFF